MTALNAGLKHIGEVIVIPTSVGDQCPFLGTVLVPMRVDGSNFMVRLGVGTNWNAQMEAGWAVEALLAAGAARVHCKTWCLLCS